MNIINSYAFIRTIYDVYLECSTVCTDTRSIQPNSLFFALKGGNFNGNEFAVEALQRGAKYVVIDDERFYVKDGRHLLVNNCLHMLQSLARFHRNQLKTPIIAITGSNGKTTTKELIASILSQKFNIVATQGNLNNHIGVPLTILRLTRDHQLGVIEMGASHRGDIQELCQIATPNFGIITNIGKAHLDGMGGLEGVFATKTELYQFIKQNFGRIFINKDNKQLTDAVEQLGIKSFGYSTTQRADIIAELVQNNPSIVYSFRNMYGEYRACTSSLMGQYNFNNIMMAISVGTYFGVNNNVMINMIQNYESKNNRSQWITQGTNKVLVDCYNANPTSMELSLRSFAEQAETNKIVVLGDMMELGTYTEAEHTHIAKLAISLGFSKVYLVGSFFNTIAKDLDCTCFYTTQEAKAFFQKETIQHTSILLKGSRSNKLETLITE